MCATRAGVSERCRHSYGACHDVKSSAEVYICASRASVRKRCCHSKSAGHHVRCIVML